MGQQSEPTSAQKTSGAAPWFNAVGYDLHISMAEAWSESRTSPSDEAACREVVNTDSLLAPGPNDFHEYRDSATKQVYRIHPVVGASRSSDRLCLWFMDGEVKCKNPYDEAVAKMKEITNKLGARLVGDDGEACGGLDPPPQRTLGASP
jgi:hypothetical protein